ncbi:hypothetical protein [Gluconobacter cerinus]|uniref:Uncharacterized protein n=1 Tax=Gluconobacter cerinus TaxID=38307 RepID=A0AAV5NAP7_9PROT|nr:hypothetical protein [Gluconobacter cerinus]GLQ61572.1 hypothetical protein GCM10007867_04170 [Gluconobacter cerinus]
MSGITSAGLGISPKASGGAMSDALTDQFQTLVRDEIEDRRGRGLKAAFREVARVYGITERRVRACWHGEVRFVGAAEWESVRRGRIEALQVRQSHLQQQLERLHDTDRGAA